MMGWTRHQLEIENTHACFLRRTITRIDAARVLTQLGVSQVRITLLLSLWTSERAIADQTVIKPPPGQP